MNNSARNNHGVNARFWDRIAQRYARKPVPDQQVYQSKLTKTNRYLKPTDQVLEIGCGTGTTAIYHGPKVAQILATDISGQMIEIAKAKAQAANLDNIEFEVAGIDQLTATNSTYDVVMAHSILHLLPDLDDGLNGLHKMLKPSGLLVSSTPCIADFMSWFRYIAHIGRRLRLMPYINVFGEQDLKRKLNQTGFSIEERWLPRPKSGVYIVASKIE